MPGGAGQIGIVRRLSQRVDGAPQQHFDVARLTAEQRQCPRDVAQPRRVGEVGQGRRQRGNRGCVTGGDGVLDAGEDAPLAVVACVREPAGGEHRPRCGQPGAPGCLLDREALELLGERDVGCSRRGHTMPERFEGIGRLGGGGAVELGAAQRRNGVIHGGPSQGMSEGDLVGHGRGRQRHQPLPEMTRLHKPHARPNQPLQPTPSRLVSSRFMIKILLEIASRALASRG